MSTEKFICLYLFIINCGTFIIFGIDKAKAVLNKWRIPEKSLLFFSLVGGFLGALFGVLIFRHKINNKKILFYILLITLIWIIGIIVFLKYQ